MHRPKRPAYKRRFTEFFVRKLKPEAAAYVVWDTHQRGLAIRVQPTAVYSRQGRPRWLHLGDAGAIGLADARTLAAEAMLAVARGKDPAAERKAERGAGTFAELAEVHRAAREEAQQVVAAGRSFGQPVLHAEVGQAAGLDHHPR
jgi:hypothetical protein